MVMFAETRNLLAELPSQDSLVVPIYLTNFSPQVQYAVPTEESLAGTALAQLHECLMQPFVGRNNMIDISGVTVMDAAAGSALRVQAAGLVDFAYTTHYHRNHGEVVTLSSDEFEALSQTRTVVAVHQTEQGPMVLGTLRTIHGENLDVFQLFGMAGGSAWPHARDSSVMYPGELGRFCTHPVLDVARQMDDPVLKALSKQAKIAILRKLWAWGMGRLREDGVEMPYFILAPPIRRFVQSAGIIPIEVAGEQPSRSDYAQQIRRTFAEYWKPDAPREEQPQVYLAPWDLLPIPATD